MNYGAIVFSAMLCCVAPDVISGSDIFLIIPGSPGDSESTYAVEGFFAGILKSGNSYLANQITAVNVLFMELDSSVDLFYEDSEPVFPWMQAQFNLMSPSVAVSIGSAASFVENLTSTMTQTPIWHLKCVQATPCTRGTFQKGTCTFFSPEPQTILEDIFQLKPSTREVVLLNDGSSFANSLADSLSALTLEETEVFCSACNVVNVTTTTLQQLRTAVQEYSLSNESFFLLPSIEGLGTAQDVWSVLQGNSVGEMVPLAVAKLGALVAFRAHSGVAAEECGVLVAQADLEVLSSFEALPSQSFKLSLNMARAKDTRAQVRVGENERVCSTCGCSRVQR